MYGKNIDTMDFYKIDMYFNIDMSILYKNTTHNCWYKNDSASNANRCTRKFLYIHFMTH